MVWFVAGGAALVVAVVSWVAFVELRLRYRVSALRRGRIVVPPGHPRVGERER